jgi:hypothetical protein
VRIGAAATEAEIKRLNASGELFQHRILHFATHGVTAGELKAEAEPDLVLTPPAAKSEEDNAYLSASEIAVLKLEGDWVILSACNTAAGAAKKAEALSSLARAFIYAGARAALGDGVQRHRQAHHRRGHRDGPRPEGRPCRSHAAGHAGAHRPRRPARGGGWSVANSGRERRNWVRGRAVGPLLCTGKVPL